MSTESAKNQLSGHGRVICKGCGTVIISCKCMKCVEDIKYDVCDKCEKDNLKKDLYSIDEAISRMKETPGLKMTMPSHYRSYEYNYYDAEKKELLTESGVVWDVERSRNSNELTRYADYKENKDGNN